MRCVLAGRAEPGRVRSVGVSAGEKAVRAPGSAGSSGPEGGAAASARAALYPREEAPRRHPVTPGLAGPAGLPPRHSLAPARRPTIATDLPADRHRSPKRANDRPTSASPGRTKTSVHKARPHASEWPVPAAGSKTRTAIGHITRRSVLSSAPTGCSTCPSLFCRPNPPFSLRSLVTAFACPAPAVHPDSRERLAVQRGVGGTGPRSWWREESARR